MAEILRSPRARADLVSIGDEVAERMQSLASANRVLNAIEQKFTHYHCVTARVGAESDQRAFARPIVEWKGFSARIIVRLSLGGVCDD